MTRRKGEITAGQNERDIPHRVELPLPPGGFRDKTFAMEKFHRERGIESRYGRGRRDDKQFYVTYCFAEPAIADEFQAQFGGERSSLA